MMQLACIAEGLYLRHAAAMLHSVLSLTPAPAKVHVLHESEVPAEDRTRFESVVHKFSGQVVWHRMPPEIADDFPGGYFHRSIWVRVLLPRLLPDVERVLYLDADLIAADSLLPLWQTPLDDHLLAAVTNPLYPFMLP
ncbi:MAG TPA: glycosyltransferase, partial [Nevskiaceae bacterium]|nr:glycosyltransferase [Nevskiaceae bacterium]